MYIYIFMHRYIYIYCVYIVGNYCVGSVLYQVRKLIQEARLPLFRFCFLFFSDLPQSNPTEIIGPETRHTQAAMKSPTNDMARNRFHMTKFFEENRPPSPIKGAASKFGQPKEARIKHITPMEGWWILALAVPTCAMQSIGCFDCFRKVSIKKCIPNGLLKFPSLKFIGSIDGFGRWRMNCSINCESRFVVGDAEMLGSETSCFWVNFMVRKTSHQHFRLVEILWISFI